jgi:FkbM family methyltransferase
MPQLDRGIRVAIGKVANATALFRGFLRQIPRLGLGASARAFVAEASTRRPLSTLVRPFVPERLTLRPSGYRHSLMLRRVGTDLAVLRQMLVKEEYSPVSSLRRVRLIVDCGANIGLSSYYLLHRYGEAHVIAVEPDEANCALCRSNLAAFGERATVLQAAVWPENRRLRIVPASRARGSWALRVEPDENGDIEGLTLDEILRRAGKHGPIDLLKMDIEGAETEVFGGSPAWLAMTRNIAIELHGDEAHDTFIHALDGYQYEERTVDEITVIYGLHPMTA